MYILLIYALFTHYFSRLCAVLFGIHLIVKVVYKTYYSPFFNILTI